MQSKLGDNHSLLLGTRGTEQILHDDRRTLGFDAPSNSDTFRIIEVRVNTDTLERSRRREFVGDGAHAPGH